MDAGWSFLGTNSQVSLEGLRKNNAKDAFACIRLNRLLLSYFPYMITTSHSCVLTINLFRLPPFCFHDKANNLLVLFYPFIFVILHYHNNFMKRGDQVLFWRCSSPFDWLIAWFWCKDTIYNTRLFRSWVYYHH